MPRPERTKLKLSNVRDVFRLVGTIRQSGADPKSWRPLLVRRLLKVMRAQVVVSSEVHFRRDAKTGTNKLYDLGWGCDGGKQVWEVRTETENAQPESYWLATGGGDAPADVGIAPVGTCDTPMGTCDTPMGTGAEPVGTRMTPAGEESAATEDEIVAVKPTRASRGGEHFILSQVSLPHVGAVDQLCLHRAWDDAAFTDADYRLVRLFHTELGRLWKQEAIRRAKDRKNDLPPRLKQTLNELLAGSSEKQIALKLQLSQHTIHNYVKALHQRFDATSRGELLAKAGEGAKGDFTPKLSF